MPQVSSPVGSQVGSVSSSSGSAPPFTPIIRGPVQSPEEVNLSLIPGGPEYAQAVPHDPLARRPFSDLIALAERKHLASRQAIAKGFRYGVEAGEALVAARQKYNPADHGGLSWTAWAALPGNVGIPKSTAAWYVQCATYRAEIEFLSDDDYDLITQSGARRVLTQMREARNPTNTPAAATAEPRPANPEPPPQPHDEPKGDPVIVEIPPREPVTTGTVARHPAAVAGPGILSSLIRSGRALIDLNGVLTAVRGLTGDEVRALADQLREIGEVAQGLTNLTGRLIEAD